MTDHLLKKWKDKVQELADDSLNDIGLNDEDDVFSLASTSAAHIFNAGHRKSGSGSFHLPLVGLMDVDEVEYTPPDNTRAAEFKRIVDHGYDISDVLS